MPKRTRYKTPKRKIKNKQKLKKNEINYYGLVFILILILLLIINILKEYKI